MELLEQLGLQVPQWVHLHQLLLLFQHPPLVRRKPAPVIFIHYWKLWDARSNRKGKLVSFQLLVKSLLLFVDFGQIASQAVGSLFILVGALLIVLVWLRPQLCNRFEVEPGV